MSTGAVAYARGVIPSEDREKDDFYPTPAPATWAMLLRLAWLEGSGRKALFESTPLSRVYVASRRLAMNRGGIAAESGAGGMIAFSWFVWDRAHKGAPQLGWFDWKEAA